MHTRASFTALIGMALAVLVLALLLTSDSASVLRAAGLGTPPDQQSAEQGSQAVAPAPPLPVYPSTSYQSTNYQSTSYQSTNYQSTSSHSTITFAYDDAGRLVQARYGGGTSAAYTYDTTGNLTQYEACGVLAVQIAADAGDVVLTWTHSAACAGGYEVWRSTSFYFEPGANCSAPPPGMACTPIAAPGDSYRHVGAASDVANNYAYRVFGLKGTGERCGFSSRVGEFSFGLTPGAQ